MTAPRGKVEASLAERGRPAMWANEQEAAARCGLSADKYREKLPEMEANGFPQVFPMNGLRFIPWIDAYILKELDAARGKAAESTPEDEMNLENFGAHRKSA